MNQSDHNHKTIDTNGDVSTPAAAPNIKPFRYLPWLPILVIFFIFVGGHAAINLNRLYNAAIAGGPNTVGEAGKIYYVKQFINGQSIFDRGTSVPYYPSVHGALLHVSVGLVGKLFNLDLYGLYYTGRLFSILFTLASLWLLIIILRRHGGNWQWSIAMVAVFFSVAPLITHTTSYRPDNWVMFFSVLAAYILITNPLRFYILFLLAVIPITAFFIKATGLYIAIAVFIYLIVVKRHRDALIYALTVSILFAATILIINAGTNGLFAAGLISGAKVPYSWLLMVQCLNVPQMWLFLIIPILMATQVFPVDTQIKKERAALLIFFFISFLIGLVTSRRLGANAYYFLDSFAFGLVITISWLAYYLKYKPLVSSFQTVTAALLVLLYLFQGYGYSFGMEIGNLVKGRTRLDIALSRTQIYKHDREKISAICNEENFACFSDDAGLNVMLDKPQVIFPLVQVMLIQSGLLSEKTMIGPLEKQEYNLVILTGSQWRYFNVNPIPSEFSQALNKYYREIKSPSKYHVFKRKKVEN